MKKIKKTIVIIAIVVIVLNVLIQTIDGLNVIAPENGIGVSTTAVYIDEKIMPIIKQILLVCGGVVATEIPVMWIFASVVKKMEKATTLNSESANVNTQIADDFKDIRKEFKGIKGDITALKTSMVIFTGNSIEHVKNGTAKAISKELNYEEHNKD